MACRSFVAELAPWRTQSGSSECRTSSSQLPEKWGLPELTDSAQPEAHGKAHHTPVKEQAAAAQQPSPPKRGCLLRDRLARLPAQHDEEHAAAYTRVGALAGALAHEQQSDAAKTTRDKGSALPPPAYSHLTPGKRHVEHTMHVETPAGQHFGEATYKVAASTPIGETSSKRADRLGDENKKKQRATAVAKALAEEQRDASKLAKDFDEMSMLGGVVLRSHGKSQGAQKKLGISSFQKYCMLNPGSFYF